MAVMTSAGVGSMTRGTSDISRRRMAAAGIAVFILANVGAVIVHGFLLAADYAPYYGTLLRGTGTTDGQPAWQFVFLPVVHLSFTIGLVWLFRVARADDSWRGRALKLGVMAWLIGPAPMWLLWYAEQPWPAAIVLKQLPYELAVALVLALTAGAILRPRPAAIAR
jgi:hypothetical protein